MEFQDYAVRETSDLVGRLVAGASEKVVGDLQALRQAFDMVTGALDAALANQTGPEYRDEVARLAERLAAEAAKAADAAREEARRQAQVTVDELKATIETRTAENAALTDSLSRMQAQVDGLHAKLREQAGLTDAARAECSRAEEAVKRTEAARRDVESVLEKTRSEYELIKGQLQAAREMLEGARAESSKLSAQRDAGAAQNEKLSAALSAVTTELQDTKTQNKELVARAKASAAEIDKLQRENDDHHVARSTLEARLEKSTENAATLQKRADEAEREVKRLRGDVQRATEASAQATRALEENEVRAGRLLSEQSDRIRQHAGGFLATALDRLFAMYQVADNAATMEQVLAAIVDAVATQFPRVALFRVHDKRLEGVRQTGFDLNADISQVLIPRTLDSLVTQAVGSGHVETRSGKKVAETSGMPFTGTPQYALAVPIIVDGEALAVVYADDSGQTEREFAREELRVTFAQLVQRQVVPLLARLVAEAKVIAELDQYAGLLVKELQQTYDAELKAGGNASEADRRKDLRDNLEYARQMYAQRAAAEGPKAAPLFEQKLLGIVEAHSDTPFARDIVAAIGGRKRQARAAKAEAS